MRAGKLRESIEIHQRVTVTDSDYGSQKHSFELYFKSRAEVRFLNGAEIVQNSAATNTTNVTFYMRFKEGVDETMQVNYRGDMFNIEVIEEDRKRKMLKLTGSKITI